MPRAHCFVRAGRGHQGADASSRRIAGHVDCPAHSHSCVEEIYQKHGTKVAFFFIRCSRAIRPRQCTATSTAGSHHIAAVQVHNNNAQCNMSCLHYCCCCINACFSRHARRACANDRHHHSRDIVNIIRIESGSAHRHTPFSAIRQYALDTPAFYFDRPDTGLPSRRQIRSIL